ncbi:MAG: DUF2520 domain-containing protein [Clostridium sp.]|uniref:Rossmann-like and DUF2520 domain-containing protein n=1 Tax=Clostridium sp. TaxID=1506 RepID=UPI0025B87852|nr:DUF2520 domain-containing protein [Clostridium sp.]MCE5221656.1 DUF2520 domain-containing protein [Clostridium sp.]
MRLKEIRMLYHAHGGDTIKIGFIGPGKVGVSLGRYFTHKGIKLSGFYGRNIKSTRDAANITKSKLYDNIQNIVKESDILFITTPDDMISIIDRELSKFDLNNKSICHTSGSLKSNVLCNAKHSGALIYSIHPIFAFSNKNTNLKKLEDIYFSIEGDDLENSSLNNNINEGNFPIINLIKTLGNKFFIRSEETSSIYHLATVFVSNLTLSLLEIGTSYLKKLGLNEEDALNAIKPLVQGNIDSIIENGFMNSLTGPILRGDITTIDKHLSVLEKEDKDLYKILSLNLLKLVALKENSNISNSQNKQGYSLNIENENILQILLNNSEKHSVIYKILGGLD